MFINVMIKEEHVFSTRCQSKSISFLSLAPSFFSHHIFSKEIATHLRFPITYVLNFITPQGQRMFVGMLFDQTRKYTRIYTICRCSRIASCPWLPCMIYITDQKFFDGEIRVKRCNFRVIVIILHDLGFN